ncbi:hypothetical protein HY477_01235 [Candidatus Uhrbacteria bacterium]|nr:hypothetical protein [Candidatus Uhrbacteria bacterium]
MILNQNKGFTLLEVLISLGGGILVLFAVLNIFSLSREALRVGGQRAELTQNARIALERIARDLRQAETLVSALPETDSDPENPPPSEIEFYDGHDPDALTYIRYHLVDGTLLRELSYYAFPSDPNVRVYHNTLDQFGNLPDKTVTEDLTVAELVLNLEFFGEENITILITVAQSDISITVPTTIFARNLTGT